MSTSPKKAALQPKPFTKDEYERCLRAIGLTDQEVRRLIGLRQPPGRRKVRPEEFTRMQARSVRMLAVRPDLREFVVKGRDFFPDIQINSITATHTTGKKAG